MGKIVLLVPREEIVQTAHNILQEMPGAIEEMRVIDTADTVVEARQAVAGGASIIIARGLQASLIKQYLDVPLVQIRATAQEMAILVIKARQIVKKDKPIVAVVGFENMFCDMSFFSELYGIELRTYYAKTDQELAPQAVRATEDGADIIIGGDTAVSVAQSYNIPSLFLITTEDSLRQAISAAKSLDYAMSVEKKNAAQMETLMDYSYNGVIRIDKNGIILTANQTMEQIADVDEEELIGKNIREYLSKLDEKLIDDVLFSGKENAVIADWGNISLYVIFAPIVYDDHIDGALLTFHRIKREFSGSRKTGERLPVDFIPVTQFDDISQRSGAMKECINSAKLFAMSDRPVVLAGETGTERRMIAESIHNFGEHSKGAFVEVSCAGLSSEQQKELIFSEKGALHKAQEGTLFITDLEMMTDDNQHRLYRTLRYNLIPDEDGKNTYSNVRVITTAPRPLIELYNDGIIRRELYYILSGLELIVPPLCKRPEDLSYHLDAVLRRLYARYGRFHVLSAAAREYLFSYEWPGNLLQLESFCERLVITAGKRSISEAAVRQLMEEMYGELPVRFSQSADASACETQQVGISNTAQNIVQTGDNGTPFSQLGMPPAASCIIKALEDNAGNRPKAAAQLGISTTTLWRRMNKYGIEW